MPQGAKQRNSCDHHHEGGGRFPPPLYYTILSLTMRSLIDFQASLRSIADELGQREVHLGTLGSLVRQRMPNFSAAEYGFRSFTELIGSCTELGELRCGEKSGDRWFVFHEVGSPTRSLLKKTDINKQVWHACVALDESQRAWLDLIDRHIEAKPSTVDEEPERYLEFPRFGRARQLALLRDFAEGHEQQVALLRVAENWTSEESYPQLLEALQQLGLRTAWFTHLHQAVEGELRHWAARHGIPLETLFTSRNRSSRTHSELSYKPLGLTEPGLRAFLKAALDEMTLVELGQIPVPARLLLKDNGD